MARNALSRAAVLLTGAMVALFVLNSGGAAQAPVVRPLVASFVVALVFVVVVLKGDDRAQLDEIGLWYMGTLVVYTALPLLTYLALGMQYTPLNDSRLFAIQPTPADVATVAWFYVLYAVAFGCGYVWLRRSEAPQRAPQVRLNVETVTVICGLWAAVAIVLAFQLSFLRTADGYADQYLIIQQLPLGLRQLIKLLDGFRGVLTILLLVVLFSRFKRTKWVIAGVLAWQLVATIVLKGSRTELMITGAASAILFHRFVKPVRISVAVMVGFAGVIGFLALGVLRSLQSDDESTPFSEGVSAGEFESLFANAIDLRARRLRGDLQGPLIDVALADLVGPIPSQLLPFAKQDASIWYLQTFYPEVADRGGGMAFGAVSQSVVGFGIPEVLARGLITGLLLAAMQRYYRRRSNSLWVIAFNCWLAIWSYQSFRASTFYLITPLIQIFAPTLLMVLLGSAVVAGAARAGRTSALQESRAT